MSLCEFLLALIDTGTVQLQQIPNLVLHPVERQLLFPQATSADWDTPPTNFHQEHSGALPELKFHTVMLPFAHFLPTPLKFSITFGNMN